MIIEGNILIREGIVYGQVQIEDQKITSVKIGASGGADIKLTKD